MADTPVEIVGLHHVEWREVGLKPTQELYWEKNQTCPCCGEKRWVNVLQWHQTPVGGRLWLLYQPALSLFNGWDTQPHELDDSAIVECEITQQFRPEWHREADDEFRASHPDVVEAMQQLEAQGATFLLPSQNEYRGWVEVICRRVIHLADIPLHFGESQAEHILPRRDEKDATFAESAKLVFLSRMHQEASEWWVVTKTTPARLVLSCFEVGLEPFEICNVVVAAAEQEG